jgi:hypothetical protein
MDLQNRLTKNLLDLIESNNHYWDIIRKKNETIIQQQQQLKIFEKEFKKMIKSMSKDQELITFLKKRILELNKEPHNHQKRTEH